MKVTVQLHRTFLILLLFPIKQDFTTKIDFCFECTADTECPVSIIIRLHLENKFTLSKKKTDLNRS